MRVAIGQFSELNHEKLSFAAQIGASGVVLNTPVLPGQECWELDDLIWLRARCEQYGLRLEALENTPMHFYDKAILGLPGRDAQIENYQRTIRNMGAAGITTLGYHWMANDVWRTSLNERGRGGARVSAFDLDRLNAQAVGFGMGPQTLQGERAYTEEEIWQNYVYFMNAVLPVAEEAGVQLALHPDDPPVASIGGVARIFYHTDGFARALAAFPSRHSGIDFCVGTWSEMGVDVLSALRQFGEQGRIVYVHFRDVQGSVPRFRECFLGEGNLNPVEVIRVLHQVGFEGFIIDDHVPGLVDDTEWGHRGHAYATGYISGLVEAVRYLA